MLTEKSLASCSPSFMFFLHLAAFFIWGGGLPLLGELGIHVCLCLYVCVCVYVLIAISPILYAEEMVED